MVLLFDCSIVFFLVKLCVLSPVQYRRSGVFVFYLSRFPRKSAKSAGNILFYPIVTQHVSPKKNPQQLSPLRISLIMKRNKEPKLSANRRQLCFVSSSLFFYNFLVLNGFAVHESEYIDACGETGSFYTSFFCHRALVNDLSH